jgi:hypothetical protein
VCLQHARPARSKGMHTKYAQQRCGATTAGQQSERRRDALLAKAAFTFTLQGGFACRSGCASNPNYHTSTLDLNHDLLAISRRPYHRHRPTARP